MKKDKTIGSHLRNVDDSLSFFADICSPFPEENLVNRRDFTQGTA